MIMLNLLEQELADSKRRFGELRLPSDEELEQRIRKGIVQAHSRRRQPFTRLRPAAWSGAALITLFLLLALTVRVSPVFASAISDIPGMKVFVKLIRNMSDQGIQSAVEKEFIQPVGVTDVKNGASFTVDGIVADESRLVGLYTLRSPDNRSMVMDRLEMTDKSGKQLQGMFSWGPNPSIADAKKEPGVRRGTFDIQMANGAAIPEEMTVRAAFREEYQTSVRRVGDEPLPAETADQGNAQVAGSNAFEVRMPVDKKKFADLKKEYSINQTIESNGQKITVTKAVIEPLHISVELAYDPSNSIQIFDPADIRLTDETGAVWRNTGGSRIEKDRYIVYFESAYFHAPKELYVEGTFFRALDKNRFDVVIDTERKQMLQAPDDKLSLKDVQKTDSFTKISLALNGLQANDKMAYSVLETKFKDSAGDEHEMGSSSGEMATSWSTEHPEAQDSYYYLKNEAYPQPLTFWISSYPNYVVAPFRIRIQ